MIPTSANKRSALPLSEIDPNNDNHREQNSPEKKKKQKTTIQPAAVLDDDPRSYFRTFTKKRAGPLHSRQVHVGRPRFSVFNRRVWQLRCIHHSKKKKTDEGDDEETQLLRILLVHGATPLSALNRYIAESFGKGHPSKPFDHRFTKGHNPPNSFFTWEVNEEEKGFVSGTYKAFSNLYATKKTDETTTYLDDYRFYVADVFLRRGDSLVYYINNTRQHDNNDYDDNLWSVQILMDGMVELENNGRRKPNFPMLVGADKSLGKSEWYRINDKFLGGRKVETILVSASLTPQEQQDVLNNQRRIPYFDSTGHEYTWKEKHVGFDGLEALHEQVRKDFDFAAVEKQKKDEEEKKRAEDEKQRAEKIAEIETAEGMKKIDEFFNGLSISRGSEELRKWTGSEIVELSEEEYDMIAYPFPKITLEATSGGFFDGFLDDGDSPLSFTFEARNGKEFTNRELGEALAEVESSNIGSHYRFFEGLGIQGPHTFGASWGS